MSAPRRHVTTFAEATPKKLPLFHMGISGLYRKGDPLLKTMKDLVTTPNAQSRGLRTQQKRIHEMGRAAPQ